MLRRLYVVLVRALVRMARAIRYRRVRALERRLLTDALGRLGVVVFRGDVAVPLPASEGVVITLALGGALSKGSPPLVGERLATIHGDPGHSVRRAWDRALSGEHFTGIVESRRRDEDGQEIGPVRYFFTEYAPICGPGGAVIAVAGASLDVTDLKAELVAAGVRIASAEARAEQESERRAAAERREALIVAERHHLRRLDELMTAGRSSTPADVHSP